MARNSKEIIEFLNERFPQNLNSISIKNCAERNFRFSSEQINQYIIGVTRGDEVSPDIRHYETFIKKSLREISSNVKCFPWHFTGDEIKEMKNTLDELCGKFKVNLDSEKIIADLKVPRDGSGSYYLVVTVVQYSIAYVE